MLPITTNVFTIKNVFLVSLVRSTIFPMIADNMTEEQRYAVDTTLYITFGFSGLTKVFM